MAALVGTPTRGYDGANNTTVASAAKTTTSGNLIAVLVCSQEGAGSTTINSVADTAGNTYTAGTAYGVGGGGAMCRWFYAYNITGHASNVVTATFSGNTRYKHIVQVEISGMDTTSAVLSGQSGNTVFASTTIQPGSFTLTGAGIFLYGICATNDRTFTPDGSYTEITDAGVDGWGTCAAANYQIAGASSSDPTGTASGSSNLTIAAIAFLDAASGATPRRMTLLGVG